MATSSHDEQEDGADHPNHSAAIRFLNKDSLWLCEMFEKRFDQPVPHLLARLPRAAAHMRRKDDARVFSKRFRYMRLLLEYIEAGPCYAIAGKCCDQRRFVDDGAAGDVD